jgi:outer membrane protein assembly factor BamD
MRSKTYILLAVLVLVSSCGQYEKLLKSTDYDAKKAKAKEYYEAGKYVKSTELLEQILPRYRATEEAEDLNRMNAQSYFGMKQYDIAGADFKSYVEQYPYGKYAEEASFMTALCNYYISPRAELDQDNTKMAIEGFTYFMSRYPSSTRMEESKKLIKELEERLVEKSYLSARLYYDMEQYKAAVTALSNSLKEYAETKYREEMMYLKLSSLFLYAEKSFANKQKERYQATLDDYFSFMEEFPKSKFAKEVKKIYQDTSKALKIEITDTTANNQ